MIGAFISLIYVTVSASSVTANRCSPSPDVGSGGNYPRHPLTYTQLDEIIIGGKNESRLYYEIYSLDPKDPSFVPKLPVLRKVVIRWNKGPAGYSNNYAGWLPPSESIPSFCITNELPFTSVPGRHLQFMFDSEFPVPEPHIGTTFSSCPERYHINWYCPQSKLVTRHGRTKCSEYLRMSIYSAYGPNTLPWHLITEDLRQNGAPPMDDPRWYMTYDAPEQCTFAQSRHRRDVPI